jgi:hypothetical protein
MRLNRPGPPTNAPLSTSSEIATQKRLGFEKNFAPSGSALANGFPEITTMRMFASEWRAKCAIPNMNIILMSGDHLNYIAVLTTFLHKPLAPAQLLKAVRGRV